MLELESAIVLRILLAVPDFAKVQEEDKITSDSHYLIQSRFLLKGKLSLL